MRIPVRSNIEICIQSQSNVNKMFEAKKIHQENKEVIIEEPIKKQKNIKGETDIMKSKMSLFNEIVF
jgi:hypothetical protein